MQQNPEWAYIGTSRGPHRVGQKHKALNQGGLEGERKAAKQFDLDVFPICTKSEGKTNALFLKAGSSLVCTALTEPGQLPLSCHGAARLVRRSPGLPATFRAKSHGMSDGMQTLIMVLVKFFQVLFRR